MNKEQRCLRMIEVLSSIVLFIQIFPIKNKMLVKHNAFFLIKFFLEYAELLPFLSVFSVRD